MTRSTPESSSTPETHRARTEDLQIINLHGVEDFRDAQSAKYNAEVYAAASEEAEKEAKANFIDTEREYIDAYLASKGIAEDDPLKDAYADILDNLSITTIPERDWLVGPYEVVGEDDEEAVAEQSASGRDIARELYGGFVACYSPETSVDSFDSDDDDEAKTPTTPDDDPETTPIPIVPPETDAEKTMPIPVIDNRLDPDEAWIEAHRTEDVDTAEIDAYAEARQREMDERRKEAEDIEKSVEYQEAKEDYEEARDKLAKLAAKRATKLFTGKKAKDEYVEARKEFNQAMINLGRYDIDIFDLNNHIESPEGDELTQVEQAKREFAVGYALGKEGDLDGKINDNLSNTALVKIMDSGIVKFMIDSKHTGVRGFAEKAAKSAALAAGLSFVITPLGAGLAAGALLAFRGAKTAAVYDAKQGRALEASSNSKEERDDIMASGEIDEHFTAEAALVRANRELSRDNETSIKEEQFKRIKSVGAGVLGVALGATFSHILISGSAGGGAPAPTPEQPSTPLIRPDSTPQAPTPMELNGTDRAPIDLGSSRPSLSEAAPAPAPASVDVSFSSEPSTGASGADALQPGGPSNAFAEAARGANMAAGEFEYTPGSITVREGMGFGKVMNALHINPIEQGEVLRLAGPELEKAGYAYWDSDRGNWGLLYPKDGNKLADQAANILLSHVSK